MKKAGLILLFISLSFFSARAAAGPFYINEILFNGPGTDSPNEYVEIRGTPNVVIPAGTYLIGIEGDTNLVWGQVQTIFNLSGMTIGSNGFLVLRQAGNSYTVAPGATVMTGVGTGFGGVTWFSAAPAGTTDIENATTTFILAQSPVAPVTTDDIDSDNNGTPDGAFYAGLTINDSIGILDTSAVDAVYGEFNICDGSSGSATGTRQNDTITAGYVARRGNTTGSTGADWVATEILNGTAPNFRLGIETDTFPDSWAGAQLNHIGAANVFVPTAASVEVSGRVLTARGGGIARAIVLMTDSLGNTRSARTNSFGYYHFSGVRSGETYVFQISSKEYEFTPQVIVIADNISDLNFILE